MKINIPLCISRRPFHAVDGGRLRPHDAEIAKLGAGEITCIAVKFNAFVGVVEKKPRAGELFRAAGIFFAIAAPFDTHALMNGNLAGEPEHTGGHHHFAACGRCVCQRAFNSICVVGAAVAAGAEIV